MAIPPGKPKGKGVFLFKVATALTGKVPEGNDAIIGEIFEGMSALREDTRAVLHQIVECI